MKTLMSGALLSQTHTADRKLISNPLLFLPLITAYLLLTTATRGWAYQEIVVTNGGALQGKVTLNGKIPYPRVYHLILFPNLDLCDSVDTDEQKNRILNDFITDEQGGLKDVVISLEKVEAGKPFDNKPVTILAKNCKFTPDVSIIQQGETLFMDNRDEIMHNSQVFQRGEGDLLRSIPIPATKISEGEVVFKESCRIFQMICVMHEFMQTWGYRVQNPYHFKTGVDGDYIIDNIPPGEYIVNAWHFLMKIQSKTIKISAGRTAKLDFEFDKKNYISYSYRDHSGSVRTIKQKCPGTGE
jgi:hypothetical protein